MEDGKKEFVAGGGMEKLKEIMKTQRSAELEEQIRQHESVLNLVGFSLHRSPDKKGFALIGNGSPMLELLVGPLLVPTFSFRLEFEALPSAKGSETCDMATSVMMIDLMRSIEKSVKDASKANIDMMQHLKKMKDA